MQSNKKVQYKTNLLQTKCDYIAKNTQATAKTTGINITPVMETYNNTTHVHWQKYTF